LDGSRVSGHCSLISIGPAAASETVVLGIAVDYVLITPFDYGGQPPAFSEVARNTTAGGKSPAMTYSLIDSSFKPMSSTTTAIPIARSMLSGTLTGIQCVGGSPTIAFLIIDASIVDHSLPLLVDMKSNLDTGWARPNYYLELDIEAMAVAGGVCFVHVAIPGCQITAAAMIPLVAHEAVSQARRVGVLEGV